MRHGTKATLVVELRPLALSKASTDRRGPAPTLGFGSDFVTFRMGGRIVGLKVDDDADDPLVGAVLPSTLRPHVQCQTCPRPQFCVSACLQSPQPRPAKQNPRPLLHCPDEAQGALRAASARTLNGRLFWHVPTLHGSSLPSPSHSQFTPGMPPSGQLALQQRVQDSSLRGLVQAKVHFPGSGSH